MIGFAEVLEHSGFEESRPGGFYRAIDDWRVHASIEPGGEICTVSLQFGRTGYYVGAWSRPARLARELPEALRRAKTLHPEPLFSALE